MEGMVESMDDSHSSKGMNEKKCKDIIVIDDKEAPSSFTLRLSVVYCDMCII